jgi:hypothetical protein
MSADRPQPTMPDDISPEATMEAAAWRARWAKLRDMDDEAWEAENDHA